MIYYQDNEVTIRTRTAEDAQIIADEQIRQGWHSSPEWFLKELRDHEEGKCISLTAEYMGNVAGYVNVYRAAKEGPFVSSGYPEINNFGVLQKYQRHGIGSRLMDAAEQIAADFADTVCLGVGLHNGYGSAQRMYVKRGYVPDGSGVWYGEKPCTPYDTTTCSCICPSRSANRFPAAGRNTRRISQSGKRPRKMPAPWRNWPPCCGTTTRRKSSRKKCRSSWRMRSAPFSWRWRTASP